MTPRQVVTDSQNPDWRRGFNDGMVEAVVEMLYCRYPQQADLLIHHVAVDELTREQVRRIRALAQKHYAVKVLDALRTAKADQRGSVSPRRN